MTTVQEMLARGAPIDEIAAWLDQASAQARVDAVFALDRAGQRALFERAGTGTPFTLDHFVPSDVADVRAVHHSGKNTLPLPAKHRFFEKRFARPPGERDRLFGYNQSPSKKLVGPGYFVAVYTRGNPTWEQRGAIVVDYFQVPDGQVPADWPAVIPNSQGLQRFVYKGTRDFMRRVSAHVSIGAAYKGEKALGHFFVLVRQDS